MATCERCWDDSRAAEYSRGVDQVEEYERLLDERRCTPEQQAGSHARKCPKCGRMTIHQHIGERECMAGCGVKL